MKIARNKSPLETTAPIKDIFLLDNSNKDFVNDHLKEHI
jgi:hypothetical protein